MGIPEKIDELVGILLENAIKYSDENAHIQLGLYSEKGIITLCCKNPCSDFPNDSIPNLFDRFYRCDKSHSGQIEGYGLGLSIAKEIVAIHKGNIYVEYTNKNFIINVKF